MKATDLLKQQHKEVEKLFAQLEKAEEAEKAAIRAKIADDLAAHATIEQEMFYPAARKALGDLPILRESLEEHGVIEFCLVKLLGAGPKRDADSFDAKATVLKESVMHHVEEEEGDLFKKVEKAMEKEQLEDLGRRRRRRRARRFGSVGHDILGMASGARPASL